MTMADISEVGSWYKTKPVFITGATGFMGKVLVEKLLRDTDVPCLYLLVRPKRGLDVCQRREDYINHTVFDEIRSKSPEKLTKIHVIPGDILIEGLGISLTDRQLLQDNIHVVFHCAANVRFDQALKDAVNMNTAGTKRVLTLAEGIRHLEAFIHVSTSYCHCDEDILEEKQYQAPNDPEKLMQAMTWMDPEILEMITPKLIKSLPNTYAYTKSLTEELVCSYKDKFPIAIGRPSIVTAAWQEPKPGWIDNLNGPTGLLVGAGKGVVRSMHCNESYLADLMPVDISINALIGLAWTLGTKKAKTPYFCNITESGDNKISWGEALACGRKHLYENPFSICLWYPDGSIKASWLYHMLSVIFFHFLPAYFIDGLMIVLRRKPFMVKIQKRIHGGLKVLQYYTTKEWCFKNDNLKLLSQQMNKKDREIFYTDIKQVDWDEYMRRYILGTRKYCLKEDPANLPEARKFLQKLYYIDLVKNILLGALIAWLVWTYCTDVADVVHNAFDVTTNLFKMAPIARVMGD